MNSPARETNSQPRPTRTITDLVMLALCTISLAAYLGFSLSVRAFADELIRLAGKFLG